MILLLPFTLFPVPGLLLYDYQITNHITLKSKLLRFTEFLVFFKRRRNSTGIRFWITASPYMEWYLLLLRIRTASPVTWALYPDIIAAEINVDQGKKAGDDKRPINNPEKPKHL